MCHVASDEHTGASDEHTGASDEHTGGSDEHTGASDEHTGGSDVCRVRSAEHTGGSDVAEIDGAGQTFFQVLARNEDDRLLFGELGNGLLELDDEGFTCGSRTRCRRASCGWSRPERRRQRRRGRTFMTPYGSPTARCGPRRGTCR